MNAIEKMFPLVVKLDLLPETIALVNNAGSLVAEAKPITITSAIDYTVAAEQMQKVKGISKSLDAARKELTKPLDEEKTKIMDQFKPLIGALYDAECLIKKGMIAFDQEQDRLRRIAEAEAAERARKEREKLEAQALKAAEKGKDEKAEALIEQAASVVAAPVPALAPVSVSGIAKKMEYSAEVTDLLALVKAVAEGRAPINMLQADMKVLNGLAKSLKESFDGMYPGVRLVKEAKIAARSSVA